VVPPGCFLRGGYVLPLPGRTFKRADLIEIAAANGAQLSVALLHKWRTWRLIPGPVAGGPTGTGPGKGQTWPEGAGWRTAWIARWHADTLSYDALRLALWPWNRELDDRPADMLKAIRTFVRQDQDFHYRVEETLDDEVLDEVDPYLTLMRDGDKSMVPRVLAGTGGPSIANTFSRDADFIARLSFRSLIDVESTDAELPGRYIEAFRSSIDRGRVIDLFWNAPLALARIVVREFLRFRLAEGGEI
jgi:hypothetical protein